LLLDLARIGKGDYSFIPCPGFIGTIFVNTLSNLMSTMAVEAELNIRTMHGAMIESNHGSVNSLNMKIGDLKFG
jgi:hypothetical protein